MSYVMSSVSVHGRVNELSEAGFIRASAGYSLLMAVVFGGATALGSVWLYPTWLAPIACLAMAFICLYAVGEKGGAGGTFASVLGAMIFLGLAIGSTTALLEWRQVFVTVMIAAVIIAAVSFSGFCFTELLQDDWALVVSVNTSLLMAIASWVFASETSKALFGIGTIELSLFSWLGIIVYVGLTAYVWRKAFQGPSIYWNQNNAILTSGGPLLVAAGFIGVLKKLCWNRPLPDDSDKKYCREYGGVCPEDD